MSECNLYTDFYFGWLEEQHPENFNRKTRAQFLLIVAFASPIIIAIGACHHLRDAIGYLPYKRLKGTGDSSPDFKNVRTKVMAVALEFLIIPMLLVINFNDAIRLHRFLNGLCVQKKSTESLRPAA